MSAILILLVTDSSGRTTLLSDISSSQLNDTEKLNTYMTQLPYMCKLTQLHFTSCN